MFSSLSILNPYLQYLKLSNSDHTNTNICVCVPYLRYCSHTILSQFTVFRFTPAVLFFIVCFWFSSKLRNCMSFTSVTLCFGDGIRTTMWRAQGQTHQYVCCVLVLRFSQLEFNVWLRLSGLRRVRCWGISNVSINFAVAIFKVNDFEGGGDAVI
jgi:hypothetical protein